MFAQKQAERTLDLFGDIKSHKPNFCEVRNSQEGKQTKTETGKEKNRHGNLHLKKEASKDKLTNKCLVSRELR